MSVDWLMASVDERKALYRAVRRVMDEANLTWTEAFKQALGEERIGTGYEDTFRGGRIARKKAKRFYNWLAQDHPAQQLRLDADLDEHAGAVVDGGAAWRALLTTHGRFSGLSAILLPDAPMNIVSFAKPEPLARPVIPLGAAFCFELESGIAGAVLAFQCVNRQWYALPLTEYGLADHVAVGRQFLPRQPESDLPYPLSEESHDGRHGFVFLVGDDVLITELATLTPSGKPIAATTLDKIAQAVEASAPPWRLHRINLLFQA